MAALSRALLVFVAAQLAVAARNRGAGAGGRHLRSGSDLRPELVADLLNRVEDEWKSQAASFAACNETAGVPCAPSSVAFSASCTKVVSSVVKGSSGDRATVLDYMDEVCGEPSLQGWKREHCHSFRQGLTAFMSADDYDNRENMDVAGLCRDLWQSFSKEAAGEHELELEREEKAREEAARRAEEEAAAEKKRQEEAAKLAAEEAKRRAEEEAKRQAEEAERKAEEEKRKEEERKRQEKEEEEAAARKAEEAKHQAEEAATRMRTKQEEAAKEAELAKRKFEEAQAAAEKIRLYHAQASQANGTNASAAAAAATLAEQANSTNASAKENLPVEAAPLNSTNATRA